MRNQETTCATQRITMKKLSKCMQEKSRNVRTKEL